MTFLSLAHVLLDGRMQARFAADPGVPGDGAAASGAHPARGRALPAAGARVGRPGGAGRPPASPCARSAGPTRRAPEVQLLSNGRYHVVVTTAGGGYSRWKDLAVTRWREDTTSDNWGPFCYLRDVASGAFWSAAHQPTLQPADRFEVVFSEARAEFRSRTHQIESYTEIAVSPEDDVELRRLRLTNCGRTRRTIEVTSYAEVALAAPAADALHPAFSNLFVQTEIVRDQRAILCTRRPRSRGEASPWMFHLLAPHGASAGGALSYETDRLRFLGRGRTPRRPARDARDRARCRAPPGRCSTRLSRSAAGSSSNRTSRSRIDIVSGVAETRAACLALVGKYQDRRLANRVFALASTHAQVVLRQLNASEADAQLYCRLAGSIIYANPSLRADPRHFRPEPARAVGAVGLLGLGRPADRAAADRRRGQHRTGAAARAGPRLLADEGAGRGPRDLERGSRRLPAGAPGPDHRPHRGRRRDAHALDRPGGIFVRPAEQISVEDRTLFQSVARVIVDRQPRLAGGAGRRPAGGAAPGAVHASPGAPRAGSRAARRRPDAT